jgi:hypothetical protein
MGLDMKIYVQSRGYSQDYDYCWLPEAPLILKKNGVNNIIQSESSSVVLARYDGELVLLVTGLEASERIDFRSRKIRNSVAWVVADTEDNERKLRGIAAYALRDLLKDDIDKAVQFGGEYGFEVAFDAIRQLHIEEARDFDVKSESKLGKNSEFLKNDLAYELEERSLPKGNGFSNTPLIVVTGIKSESALMQAGVWRGLSNLVQAEGWKDPYKKSPALNEAVAKSSQTDKQKNTITFLLLFFVLIAGGIILFLLLFQVKPKL